MDAKAMEEYLIKQLLSAIREARRSAVLINNADGHEEVSLLPHHWLAITGHAKELSRTR